MPPRQRRRYARAGVLAAACGVVWAAAGLTAAHAAFPRATAETAPAPRVDFRRDVLPILRASCVRCHGDDVRESSLRLDSEDAVLRGSVWGPVVHPGRSGESPLYRRLVGLDTPAMPEEGEPLARDQIETIRAWIDAEAPAAAEAAPDTASGASLHWAYAALERPEPPAAEREGWVRNAIDRFVLARLEAEGLSPAPEASRETLIRRLSLDLVGLPPNLEEVDAFARDPAPDADETLVERLLASPHYGERWARPWLDLARYADTHGYEKDGARSIWKYRDWVIDSLNRDQSFHDFTIEQIAGDMLTGATEAQHIATGFHRNTMLNQEGGVDDEEARWETLVDRVNTTATVWLGTTLACAQCHDHKYDPFTQEDYYRLLAFFEGAEYEIFRGGQGEGWVVEPELALPTPEQRLRLDALETERAKLRSRLETQTPELRAAQAEWEVRRRRDDADWEILVPTRAASRGGARLEVQDDGSVLATGPNPEADVYELELATDRTGLTGLRLEVIRDESLPEGGPGRDPEGNFFLSAFEVEAAPAEGDLDPTPVALGEALADAARRGYAVSQALVADVASGGWALDDPKAPGLEVRRAVFAAEEPFGSEGGTRLLVRIRHQMPLAARNLGRFRIAVSDVADPLASARLPARLRAALETPPEERTAEVREELAALHRSLTPLLDPIRARLDEIDEEREALGIVTTMVMRERPSFARPATPLRLRGSFVSPGERVFADVPGALHRLPGDQMPNRLGLAHWLVDEANPLVARVTVNRTWQQLFGRGLVETSEDFGTRGARPTHPELLDWLATEFVREGWSRKALLRLIVSSATYRQSSRVTQELVERDPRNTLLARGARFRVEAEMVRDVALTASGLLNREVGGPSVFPPQPPGIWARPYSGLEWTTSEGPDRYRRGLYTYLRRTAPYPGLAVFDAPSREFCTARRVQTNTPLQALTMLNDPASFEAARALAARVIQEAPGGDAARARRGFRLCTSRAPDDAELAPLLDLLELQLERFRGDVEAARAVAGTDGNAAERAAWTIVANVLLNLDETLTREVNVKTREARKNRDALLEMTRRHFFSRAGFGIGATALGSLLGGNRAAAASPGGALHFAPKARRVVYLFMAGAPSQLDLLDHKPALARWDGQDCPDEILKGERFAFIEGVPKLLGSPYAFAHHGQSGAEISELLPNLARIADRIAIVRSVHTTQFNHAPAQIFMNTGHQIIGRPSIGSWLSYGLGSENRDLPSFMVLLSGKHQPDGGKSCWGSGFLPTRHQGVEFRSEGDPALFLSNPEGVSDGARRESLDALAALNERHRLDVGDPEIATRIASYEMAYRMQTSVPELMDLSQEPASVQERYGAEPGKASFANNCLLARRLLERDVRFVQLYHWGWDTHGTSSGDDLATRLPEACRETDRPAAALVEDLAERGLLDDTLVVWGGEFGRTPMNEARNRSRFIGRDHHPRALSMWLAGGGIKPGVSVGKTDELGYEIVEDPIEIHDLHATLLHLLGIDHEQLTYRFQGREFRLTDVSGRVVEKLLA